WLPHDRKRSCELFKKSCDGGYVTGCSSLGLCYSQRIDLIARDDRLGCSLFRRACDGKDPNGCYWLGKCAENGQGDVPRDKRRACALYQSACELEKQNKLYGYCSDAGSCYCQIGNRVQSEALYKKGCADGSQLACVAKCSL